VNAYDPDDPGTWLIGATLATWVAVDVGFAVDHSALVGLGVWPGTPGTIGVVQVRRFPLRTPLDEVAAQVRELAEELRARVAVDARGNGAFAGQLAAGMPHGRVVGVSVSAALAHAPQPTPRVYGRAALPVFQLSKKQAYEELVAEVERRSVKVARAGDHELLSEELAPLQGHKMQSGHVVYEAPPGGHDDLADALMVGVWAARRFGRDLQRAGGQVRPRQALFSSLAWT
jgi:hypothetical protein